MQAAAGALDQELAQRVVADDALDLPGAGTVVEAGRKDFEEIALAARLGGLAAMLEALRAIATYMRGDLTADDFKAFGLKRGDMTGNVRRIAETVLTRIDGEAAQ